MTSESKLERARDEMQAQIRKTAAISALRKVNHLVEEYKAEEHHARRMLPIGIALLCLAVVGVLLALFVFKFSPVERPAAAAVSKKDVLPEGARRPLRVEAGESTQPAALAGFSDRFRMRVESVGANPFPQVIRDKGLYGTVTLSTYIRTDDGTVERVEINKPSGHPELDDAAQKIVMRASPFPPPSDDLKKKSDIITITREFRFTKE